MLAFLLAAAIATMPRTFECGRWEVSAGEPSNQLTPLTAQQFTSQYASLPRTRFGAFGAPYNIEALDVFARLDKAKRRDDDIEENVARVAIAVRRHNGTKYYRLADEDGDDLVLEDEAPGERDEPQLDVRFGTPDRRLPIIRINLVSTGRGAHSGYATQTAIFVDAGFGKAKIIGETECTDGWMGGACTAFDAIHSPKPELECSWSDAARDYECEERQELDAEWTTRHEVVNVSIFAHRESPPRGAIASLQEFANQVRADRTLQAPRVVASVGVLRPAGMLADRWLLFVTTGTSVQQMARIYAVDMNSSDPAELIPVQTLRSKPEDEVVHDAAREKDELRFTPIDRDFTVDVKSIVRETPLQVVSLLLTEGKSRALFWIGGNAATGDLDALRLASEAPEYVQCNRFEVPDSVSSISISRPFAATLHIEPHWTLYNDAAEVFEEGESCARIAHVTWSDSFDVDETVTQCWSALPERRVVISPRGELSTAALPAEQSQ